jgi:hypothetical protein
MVMCESPAKANAFPCSPEASTGESIVTKSQISLGAGRMRPQAETIELDGPTVYAVAGALHSIEPQTEGWWSPHVWRGSYRDEKAWISSVGVTIDIDHDSNPKESPFAPDDDLARLCNVQSQGKIPGNLFHLSPHGARVILCFPAQCSDREMVIAASRGACALIAKAIEGLPYHVDEGTSCDIARLFFAPNAFAKGVQRNAHVVTMRAEPYEAAELARHAPMLQVAPDIAVLPPVKREPQPDYQAAVASFNAEHPLDVKRHSDTCPICEHNGCFGVLPNDRQRWFCWSSNHSGVGVRSQRGHHGDALDLFAHENGVRPIDVLLKMGYLAPKPRPEPAPVASITERRRPTRNNSYLSVLQILTAETNPSPGDKPRGVLGGRAIRFNEMTGLVELGGAELRDVDIAIVRGELERLHVGAIDKDGNEIGLKASKTDVDDAVRQIAAENSYHPVRDYLLGLAWDGVERLDHVANDLLGAEDSQLNRTLVRKFFISAVARPLSPGCKVDTMLILQGKQGALKSTFFRVLSSPWFLDTPIDISGDVARAYQTLRRAWLYEWAELETLLKARDSSAAKAFLSSPSDSYIPKYGRNPVDVKRSGVIVGTINPDEFLTDETGSRRYWPVRVGEINLSAVAEQRDQLWAEAVAMYQAGEAWWLDTDTEGTLVEAQEHHRVRDAWEDVILPWASSQGEPFTTARVLKVALEKPEGQWSKADEMRVSRILKGARFTRKAHGPNRTPKWRSPEST